MRDHPVRIFAAAAALLAGLVSGRAETLEEQWSAGGLHGTLAKPASHARGPAVLIVAGSGPTDRNGNGPTLSTDSYRLIAAGLTENGILSLRYDKRGIGESRAMATREDDVVFDHFVDDAVAAIQSLAARSDVSSVMVAGHSEGAIIALAAAERVPVAGLILLASPGRSYLVLMREQLKGRLPPELAARANATLDSLAAGQRVADLPPDLMMLFRPSVQPFLISANRFDPAAILARVKAPVLIVQAGRDIQVGPPEFDALRSAAPDARTLLLPEANHTLKVSPADLRGNIALYNNPAAPLDPALMPALIGFVRAAAP